MAGFIFERVEKKYLLNMDRYTKLMFILNEYMEQDEYGKHTISNIYFDTDDYQLIRASLDKPVYKEKLRLRAYGVPKDDSNSFIEIKKKFKGIVYKRRIEAKLYAARDYLYKGISDKSLEKQQIFKEIDYMMNLYRLKPKVYIAYDRRAYFGKDDPEFRVTFDNNIVSRCDHLDLKNRGFDRRLLDKKLKLMEIKVNGAMPMWMSKALSDIGIFPTSYSKYGEYYKQICAKRYGNSEVRYVI